MSKILALDTSTDACSVALWLDGEQKVDFRVIPRQHTKELLPMADRILSEAGLTVSQLDAIAFGRGPGSFTGIRIATGVAQGMGFAADLPLLPVSTLAAMAQNAITERQAEYVLSTLDARMNELYWAAYRAEDGLAVEIAAERVCAPQQVVLPELNERWTALGRGWVYLDQMSESVQEVVQQPETDYYPSAGDMLPLAAAMFEANEGIAAEDAAPVYLRDEVAWKKKDQQ